MSLGPVMVDLAGPELSAGERERLRHPLVGGVILFARNYESPEQIAALVEEIHGLRSPRLLVAVDQEGGRVQRFRDGFTRLPPAGRLGELWRRDPAQARRCAREAGWLMAAELRAVGVDLSFAPVLDLDRGVSGVIGDRALGRDPEQVAELGRQWMLGMREAGMAATGKHFPGHGGVRADSHHETAVDARSYSDLALEDLLPFERLIHAGLPAVMMAHVIFPAVDPVPAGFSGRWIGGILRGELGFTGAVFSDDLSMAGAGGVGGPLERARAALAAGCDMVLVCNDPEAQDRVLGGLADLDQPVSHLRLVPLHGRPAPDRAALQGSPRWEQARALVRSYDPDPLLDVDLE